MWDFVVAYYPNYDSCDHIAHNEDLHKIVNGQLEEGSDALRYYEYDLQGDLLAAYDEFAASNIYIYEQAIKGYIASL